MRYALVVIVLMNRAPVLAEAESLANRFSVASAIRACQGHVRLCQSKQFGIARAGEAVAVGRVTSAGAER